MGQLFTKALQTPASSAWMSSSAGGPQKKAVDPLVMALEKLAASVIGISGFCAASFSLPSVFDAPRERAPGTSSGDDFSDYEMKSPLDRVQRLGNDVSNSVDFSTLPTSASEENPNLLSDTLKLNIPLNSSEDMENVIDSLLLQICQMKGIIWIKEISIQLQDRLLIVESGQKYEAASNPNQSHSKPDGGVWAKSEISSHSRSSMEWSVEYALHCCIELTLAYFSISRIQENEPKDEAPLTLGLVWHGVISRIQENEPKDEAPLTLGLVWNGVSSHSRSSMAWSVEYALHCCIELTLAYFSISRIQENEPKDEAPLTLGLVWHGVISRIQENEPKDEAPLTLGLVWHGVISRIQENEPKDEAPLTLGLVWHGVISRIQENEPKDEAPLTLGLVWNGVIVKMPLFDLFLLVSSRKEERQRGIFYVAIKRGQWVCERACVRGRVNVSACRRGMSEVWCVVATESGHYDSLLIKNGNTAPKVKPPNYSGGLGIYEPAVCEASARRCAAAVRGILGDVLSWVR
ncbi:hypothetical protein J6590_021556 [Homalodisca vitripennis]|nr:hypothetical protein J6590_021556 [Homalodisca vitripennis]